MVWSSRLRRIPVPALLALVWVTGLPVEAAPRRPLADGPTADEFHLQVDDLVPDVADLDVRRFTVSTTGGRTIRFRVGEAGVDSRGVAVGPDAPGIRRLEALVLLRLGSEGRPPRTVVRQLLKYGREIGSTCETTFDAAGRTSLEGAVKIRARSGRYPVGKPLVVGTVRGEELVITVK